jgi:adenosylmethionine-8-amino-7-oxononanoate aminotransferase
MGEYLMERLQILYRHPLVGDVRGVGLFCGVELVKDRETKEHFPKEAGLAKKLDAIFMKRGLMTRPGDVIPLLPPLVITKDEVDHVIEKLDESLSELAKEL